MEEVNHVVVTMRMVNREKGKCEAQPYKTATSTIARDQAWLASSMPASNNSGYLRPGYSVPSPYNAPTPVGVGTSIPTDGAPARNYVVPSARARQLLDQQELQRLKSLRIAAQKEAILINNWRLQKLKEYSAAEISAEDDAFDRYMKNVSMLEDVFSLHAGKLEGISPEGELVVKQDETGINSEDESRLVEGMKIRLGANRKRKESNRQRLKQVVDRALLRKTEREMLDEDHRRTPVPLPAGSGRRDGKRLKAQTEDGRECLQRIEAFDTLLQKVSQARRWENMQSCVEMYREKFGCSLGYLLPHLCAPQRESEAEPVAVECSDDPTGNQPVIIVAAVPCGTNAAEPDPCKEPSNSESISDGAGVIGDGGFAVPEKSNCEDKPKDRVVDRDAGATKLERLLWHRKFVRGTGYWKVHASEETIQSMCASILGATDSIMQL